ncbi:MAG: TonB-dependent receptor [Rhodothermales bacterium]|nr:TonB-dependent receptor [Rhodothermales bacterium]
MHIPKHYNPFYLLPFALFILACFIPTAIAQPSVVRGFVTDAATEQSLQGATVVLRNDAGAFFGVATDGDGYFILNRIPAGDYAFQVSFIGFVPHETALTLGAGEARRITIALAARQAELGELLVEAEVETGVSTVTAGLESIAPAQIERVPMPGVTGDLASYLQTVPGVTVQGDQGGQFFVRGGALDQNIAYLDGMPVYMPFHVLSFYSAFPEEIINQADVYTGGFGARHGTRISSVMDVRARNGNKQNLAGALSIAPFLSTARIEGPLVKDRVSFLGSVRQSLVEQIMPNVLGTALPYHFGDQFGKIHAFINPNHSFSITALNTFDRGKLGATKKTSLGEVDSNVPDDSSEVAWHNTAFGGRYTYLSDGLPILAEASASYSDMSNEIGPREERDRTAGIESIEGRLDLTYFLSRGEVRAGGMMRASILSYRLGGQFQGTPDVAENDLHEVVGYAEYDAPLAGGRLRITPGIQLYSLPDRGDVWVDPRFRMSVQPGDAAHGLQINAAWGIYHQAIVGLTDERDIGNLFTAWVPVPADGNVPSSMHTILGAKYRIQAGVTVAAEAFYKDFQHLNVPIFSVLPTFTTALQEANGQALGIDARIDLRDRPFWFESLFDGYISYAVSKVEYETTTFTYTPGHDRRHQLNALLHAQKGELGITVQLAYGTGFPFTQSSGFDVWLVLTPDVDVTTEPGQERIAYAEPFEGKQPAYQRVDVWLERRIERKRTVATLRAGVVNLFNRSNLFYFDLFTFKRVDQLPLVPSIGFKVELR